MNEMKKLVYDVGASAIKYALMDNNAHIYEKGKETTPHDTLEHFLVVIQKIYEKYQDQINGLASSIPGTIDSSTGQIYAPGGLTYNENVNLVQKIHEFTDLPVTLENDGKSAALAEVWKGKHLFAGEFSYVYAKEGPTFMQQAWAMQSSATVLIMNVARRKQMDYHELDGLKIFEMIEQGDQDACEALDELATARGLYNLQCVLDYEKILIGGGISQQPLLIQKIQAELDKIYQALPFAIPHV